MSTTLIPPSYYIVKPRGRTASVFPSIGQAAAAIVRLAPIPATVSAMTGTRIRRLTEVELRELGQRVRLRRTSDTAIRSHRHASRR
jgi:hypothetical protein